MTAPASTYRPHRGSYQEAAYKILGEHAELSTAALADVIGCHANSVQAIMAIPLKHGMLATTKRDGLLWWRRGTHVPPPRPADSDDDEPLHGKAGANGAGPASSIFDLAERQTKSAPAAAQPDEAAGDTQDDTQGDAPAAAYPVIWPGTKHASPGEVTSPANGSQTPDGTAATPPAKAGSAFRCAIFSDGQLVLERGGEVFALDPEHTRQLVAYLDRLALEPTA